MVPFLYKVPNKQIKLICAVGSQNDYYPWKELLNGNRHENGLWYAGNVLFVHGDTGYMVYSACENS